MLRTVFSYCCISETTSKFRKTLLCHILEMLEKRKFCREMEKLKNLMFTIKNYLIGCELLYPHKSFSSNFRESFLNSIPEYQFLQFNESLAKMPYIISLYSSETLGSNRRNELLCINSYVDRYVVLSGISSWTFHRSQKLVKVTFY